LTRRKSVLPQTWLPGTAATAADPGESHAFARDLAEFIRDVRDRDRRQDLQRHGPRRPPAGSRRLDEHQLWNRLRTLPRGPGPDLMTHGDLIPGNVLVADMRLVGIIDVGGLGPADPALDLVAVWYLLDPGPRATLRDALGCDDLEWARGAAWALQQAMGVVGYYAESNPLMSEMGRRTLQRLVADESRIGWRASR
jgi:aminoglycoside phosphotransferase (APT) family kinase protein